MIKNVAIQKFKMGSADVYLMDTSDVNQQMLSEELSLELINYAQTTFKSEKRQKEWLGTRLLLKLIEGQNAQISYKATGAPILVNNQKHISISHSGTYVAIALSNCHIGLDVQLITDKAMRLKSRFLSEKEALLLTSQTDIEGAIRLWCAKEAVYKYLDIPGTELIGGIVLEKTPHDELLETSHGLQIYFNKHDNVVMAIAEK